MKNQFGASAKLAIGTVLFTVIIFFQNCSDISVSRLSQNAVACVDAADTTALFVRGYTPVSNGVPNPSQIHFEILVDTGGDTFARSGYIADWTMDGEDPQTSSVYEIDTPSDCVDHVVQAKIELCGTEYTIPAVMKFGTGGTCTQPPPIDPNTIPPSVTGTGSLPASSDYICGVESLPSDAGLIPGFSLREPPQNPACLGVVNWQRNSSGVYDRIANPSGVGVIRRDMRLNTIMSGAGTCDVGSEGGAGLSADTFLSLRIDTLADYTGRANQLQFSNGGAGAQNGPRPSQAIISECVGDFGVTEPDPSLIPPNPHYKYRRANLGPSVGKCGVGNLLTTHTTLSVYWEVRSREEIQALEGSTDYLVVNGPCLLERGKTYYINIIQSNPENIFETICHDRWRLQGCSIPGSCPPVPPAERGDCGMSMHIL